MATRCARLVRGRRIRVTRLDGCGRPIYGPDSVVVSSGVTSVAYTANLDEGEEINETNFAGERCVYEAAVPQLNGYTVELTFCEVDPDLYAMMSGQQVLTNAFGDVIGFCVDTSVSANDTAFALEVWAGAPSGGGCEEEGAQGTFGYILLPFVRGGVLGDFTIENGAVTFTISNAATVEGNHWGVGPYDVVVGADSNPAPLSDPLGPNCALAFLLTGIAPPEAQCGARPLLDPDAEPLTDVTATPTGLSVDFDPVPASPDPWWIDFGDGLWDYSEDGSTITHEYESAGTYTITAYRDDSMVTQEVVVEATS